MGHTQFPSRVFRSTAPASRSLVRNGWLFQRSPGPVSSTDDLWMTAVAVRSSSLRWRLRQTRRRVDLEAL
jgi:hypothetical protein